MNNKDKMSLLQKKTNDDIHLPIHPHSKEMFTHFWLKRASICSSDMLFVMVNLRMLEKNEH